MDETAQPVDRLAMLREPFSAAHISKLPKPTKAQTEAVRADFKKGTRCKLCGAWHHPDVVHLDYVGHAALTHRLLDTDPAWTWEPVALDADGLPKLDVNGGLWIRLTVCNVTRLGYGWADGKRDKGGDAIKEAIGDALRNAAMRFGAALDLWHKGDLHAKEDEAEDPPPGGITVEKAIAHLTTCAIDRSTFTAAWGANKTAWLDALGSEAFASVKAARDRLAKQISAREAADAKAAEARFRGDDPGRVAGNGGQGQDGALGIDPDEIPF